ncbi:MAG: sulfatase [Planctomycetota bacterium]
MLAILLWSAVGLHCFADTNSNQKNVLFIAVDDLRPELGCYGEEYIHSPNIDALAAEGVTFTRAYCQQAVCNPSRVSVMTGLRPDTTQVWDLVTDFRTTIPDAITIPQHFRANGYRALSFGKIFHNPFPDHESWDVPHRFPKSSRLWSADAKKKLAEYRSQMRASGKREAAIRRMRAVATEVVDYPESQHIDVAIADQAISAMSEHAQNKRTDGERPLFLAVGFIRPHLPFVVPRKYWQVYERDKIPLAKNQLLPKSMPEIAFGNRSLGGFYELRDYMDFANAPSPFKTSLAEEQQRELKHGYCAAISLVDAQIGRLLRALDQQGLREKTIIVLWSDHGWKLGEHNGWCKQTNFEIDTRTPLIISAPNANANGSSCDSLVELIDIYPTLCDLVEIPIPDSVEGVTIKTLLDDVSASAKDASFSQFRRRQNGREYMGYSMRTDRYRYVEWLDRSLATRVARELYDHQADPREDINIAVDSSNDDLLEQLSSKLWSTLPRPAPRPTRASKPANVN